MNPHDGDLTFLGKVLGSLPVDIHLGKLMMLGYVFGVLEETIIISMFNFHEAKNIARSGAYPFSVIEMVQFLYTSS